MKYVTLRMSNHAAKTLIEDIRANPGRPLLSPVQENDVHFDLVRVESELQFSSPVELTAGELPGDPLIVSTSDDGLKVLNPEVLAGRGVLMVPWEFVQAAYGEFPGTRDG